jgi:hypothetical protein
LPNRSGRKTNARGNVVGGESLRRKLEDLLIAIQAFCLMGLFDLIPSGFPRLTRTPSFVSCLFARFPLVPSSFFEGLFLSWWCLLGRGLADVRPHAC